MLGDSRPGRRVTSGSGSTVLERRGFHLGMGFDKLAPEWRGMPQVVSWKRWVECREAILGRPGSAKAKGQEAGGGEQMRAATRLSSGRQAQAWVEKAVFRGCNRGLRRQRGTGTLGREELGTKKPCISP